MDDGSKKALAEIYAAGDVDHARAAAKALAAEYGVRWPRRRRRSPTTSTCYSLVRVPRRALDHLRTTNPLEPTFATVRCGNAAPRPGSRAAGLAMAFKLFESAQARWRAVNAPHLVALVRAGARLQKDKLVKRAAESSSDHQAT